MDNSRNTIIAIALSVLVILAWQFFYVNPRVEADRQRAALEQQQRVEETGTSQDIAPRPGVDGDIPLPEGSADAPIAADGAAQSREAALAAASRLPVENGSLVGSINLRGARIDDLRLKDYRETVDRGSPLVTLLSPSEYANGYFAEFGFIPSAGSGTAPGPDTVWQVVEGQKLTADTPLTLQWTNDQGVRFQRRISIDNDYMFTFTDRIENGSDTSFTFSPYGRVTRLNKPATQSIFVLHEGMIGVLGEKGLEEIKYSSLEDDRIFTTDPVTGGWLGITDKYWAAALVPDGRYKPRFAYFDDGRVRYQADYLADSVTLAPGGAHESEQLLFAGAKTVNLVDRYEEERGILNFELLIDWGWFYFLTKPTFYLLDWLYRMVGNFGVAILIGTVLIKAALFPLANMSYKSMARMKKLQPELTALRERFGDDRVKMQQEMMALYKKEKINPAAGCWPMLIQVPIFFALYKVLYVTIEMRHAPFFGWIEDLAAPDPTSIFNLFGLLPYTPPDFLLLGVWPLIMGFTMFLQMQMNPAPPDPTQAMIFKWMPVVFTFMLASFPAGLVIYWAWNNTLSIIQQAVIMKRQGVPIELWENLRSLFRRKPKPAE